MKRIISFCIALIMGASLVGCGETDGGNVLKAKTDTCNVEVAADNFDKNTKIIIEEKDDCVEITAKGYSELKGVRLDTPATISFELDEEVSLEDLDKWVGVYYYGTKEYYIEPDFDKLSEGTLEFDTYHFSLFGVKKLTDEELAEKYAKQLATYEVMQEERVKELTSQGNVLGDTVNSIYEELGITDDTLRGTLVRDFVSELSSTVNGLDTSLESKTFQKNAKMAGYGLSGLELLNAAQDGDITSFSSIVSGVIVNECCDHWNDIAKNYVPGAIGSIPEALYIAIEEGNISEASEHIAKTIVSNVPVVKYTQMTAELVDYGVNMWADAEVQIAYDAYAGKTTAGGYSASPDWDTLMQEMRGAYRQLVINAKKEYCQVNNISMSELEEDKSLCRKIERQTEKAMKKQFETRKENDDKIAEKEKEYQDIIKSFNSGDVCLMTRGKNGFGRNDDATLRLARLMNIRNQIVELLGGDDPEHLYTIFGTRNVEKQNEYIAQLVDTFMKQKNNYEGKKAVIEEVKFVYDVDLTKSKSDDSSKEETKEEVTYAWVLVATEVEVYDNKEDEVYRTTYVASENSHIEISEYIWKDGPYEKATFTATFDSPPSIIYADEEFSLHHSLSCDGDVTTHFFYASSWYKPESPDVHLGGTTGRPKFANADGIACCDNGSYEGGLRFEEYTVIGSLGMGGNEGDRTGIFYCGCGADTRWIYEWQAIN
ncbi:MAG: hypothetical protein MJ245_02520 [Clostridia bacterium]|nr:hypothetical protein [Clostridia bacterium]